MHVIPHKVPVSRFGPAENENIDKLTMAPLVNQSRVIFRDKLKVF